MAALSFRQAFHEPAEGYVRDTGSASFQVHRRRPELWDSHDRFRGNVATDTPGIGSDLLLEPRPAFLLQLEYDFFAKYLR